MGKSDDGATGLLTVYRKDVEGMLSIALHAGLHAYNYDVGVTKKLRIEVMERALALTGKYIRMNGMFFWPDDEKQREWEDLKKESQAMRVELDALLGQLGWTGFQS